MAREQVGNILQHLPAAHGRRVLQQRAYLQGLGQRSGLVLSGNGRQNGGLAPAHAPIHQLNTNCNISHALQSRRRDGEGGFERDV